MYFLYLTSGAKYLAELFQALGSSFFISKVKRRGEERRKQEKQMIITVLKQVVEYSISYFSLKKQKLL